ncbi:MAG: class III poly(R)-hydroxyalkanoic acid synthase subunit PhaE [Candidatus Thiosymbion ectosymbiont of Robbea hypermnestra]|nr:class III poly(R)-hydroxyalkanoic acid synthase subunit PhaE [Candidatus Thiosymbion ectosymbiont of Robbea hypermnestra]
MADWTEQAEQMLKTWTEAQKNVWNSWQDLAGRAVGAQPKPQPFSMNPMDWFQQSMSSWTDPMGVARDAGHQVFGSQFSMMRSLELLTRAWQMVAPKLDTGQDWRSPLAGFTTNWFQQLTGASDGLLDLSKDTQSLWQSYLSEWGPLLKPWMSSMVTATGSGHLGEMMLGGSAGLSRLLSMGQDGAPYAPFADLAEIPSVGVTREHQAKLLRAFDAFVDLRNAMLEFNKMTGEALNKAVEAVMATLVEKSRKGEKVQSVRELNRLWLESADKVFSEMYVSGGYLKVQRELSSTGMTFKIMQQDVLEMVLKPLNLPTRSELDDAYKTLYELRKEVKALKKTVREQAEKKVVHEPPAPAMEAGTEETKSVVPNAIKQVETKKVVKKTPVRRKTAARTEPTT